MRPLIAILIYTLSTACFAQRNEIALSAVGNFNPVSQIWIQNNPHQVISSNRSSVGGGASYQRWLSDHVAVGAQYEQNPSAGKLLWNGATYRWPQMRYEIAAISSQQIRTKNVALFVREGGGEILTNGYSNSGWSHDFAGVEGFGADYSVSPRLVLRVAVTILESRSGCYGDRTCRATWASAHDISFGPAWKF